MKSKPILFNTEMVRGLLNGTKTVTRRVVKPHYRNGEAGFRVITNKHTGQYVRIEIFDEWEDETRWMVEPYHPGDILYVRETWYYETFYEEMDNPPDLPSGNRSWRYVYKADNLDYPVIPGHWRPSIHMPREAARIFLRVTDVRVERLQDITDGDLVRDFGFCLDAIKAVGRDVLAPPFWDSTIKKADLPLYGWDANPWVWVIKFERCEKPEGG